MQPVARAAKPAARSRPQQERHQKFEVATSTGRTPLCRPTRSPQLYQSASPANGRSIHRIERLNRPIPERRTEQSWPDVELLFDLSDQVGAQGAAAAEVPGDRERRSK